MRRQGINQTTALQCATVSTNVTHRRSTNMILGWETLLSVPSKSHQLALLVYFVDPEFHRRVGPARLHSGELTMCRRIFWFGFFSMLPY